MVWHDESCSSPSSDSIATTSKIASGIYCKNLSTIQRSDETLEPFWAVTLVWRDRTFASQRRDFIATKRKKASRNSCKNLSTIQRSDKKLRRFWAVTVVWHDETCSSPSSDSMLQQGKQPPETTVKIWARSNDQIKHYSPFELLL